MLWIKNDEVDTNVAEYDHLTIDEVQNFTRNLVIAL